MLNKYAISWYLLLIFLFIFGIIYTIPNFYGEVPSINIITPNNKHHSKINDDILDGIKNILHKKNIKTKNILVKNQSIILNFFNANTQIYAYEIIKNFLGKEYVVTLNLSSFLPNWLNMLSAKPMKLGLDLIGGIHFLMKINSESVNKQIKNKYLNDIENYLHNQFINYKVYSKYNNEINLSFKNTLMRDQIKKKLILIYGHDLVIQDYSINDLKITISSHKFQEAEKLAIQENIMIIRNRINKIGISEPIVQRQGLNYILIELPGMQNIKYAKEIIGNNASLEFRLVNTDFVFSNTSNNLVPEDSEVKYTFENKPVILYKNIVLTGHHITNAMPDIDEYRNPQVNITLDHIGGNIISEFSKKNIGKLIACIFIEYKNDFKEKNRYTLVKNEKIISIAKIQSILSNNFRITGISNFNEARKLSTLLRLGVLIAPMQIMEECIIGPTLGQENITKTFRACIFGLITSIFFMLIYYRIFGIIAVIAIFFNLILILGSMSLLPNMILTMPGIVGILLTLAISVDANVLINERIKEEIRYGYSIQQAIYIGYKKAFSSIFDSNVTMLITVFVLYYIGSNSIKGFAITTGIGIFTSMFTSFFCTRTIVNLIYRKKNIKYLSI